MASAGEVFLVEAAIRLIARHGYWLHNAGFLKFVGFSTPDAAAIRFKQAAEALDAGELTVRDDEDANVLRLAASLVTSYRLILREAVENNSRETIKLIAEAIMYADGFTTSEATPRA